MSTASTELSHKQSHAILATREERNTHHQGDTDREVREVTEERDPRGIIKRLYVEAESSLRGKRTLVGDGTLKGRINPTSNRSRHPIEI